jgi:hypothetical protein
MRPVKEVQPRRVLPDLTVPEVGVAEEVVAFRAKQRRASRKGGKAMLHNVAISSEPHIEAAPPYAAPTGSIGSGLAADAQDIPALTVSSAPVVLPQDAKTATGTEAILVRQTTTRRAKRLERQALELPLGQRWKRRLPEVCW